eukprot:8652681-Alexandrium_andersonii.AAC.1
MQREPCGRLGVLGPWPPRFGAWARVAISYCRLCYGCLSPKSRDGVIGVERLPRGRRGAAERLARGPWES